MQAPPAAPKTEHGFAGAGLKKGWRVSDSWLSYKAGDVAPVGGGPAKDPPGYKYIRQLGGAWTALWIRFHLVNATAGGPGTEENLVPASQKSNQAATWRAMEVLEQAAYNAGNTYHYATEVAYHNAAAKPMLPGDHWKEYFPKQIDAKLYKWDAAKAAWKAPTIMAPLMTGLPPMNPAAQVIDLSQTTDYSLNHLFGTESMGRFIVANLPALIAANDADEFIDRLSDKIAEVPTDTKQGKMHARALDSEFAAAQATIWNHVDGQTQPQLALQ